MGHYLAEMMCEKCGHAACKCPPKPSTEEASTEWMVLPNFSVVRVANNYKRVVGTSGVYAHYMTARYKSAKAAEKAAKKSIQDSIAQMKEDLQTLEKRLAELSA